MRLIVITAGLSVIVGVVGAAVSHQVAGREALLGFSIGLAVALFSVITVALISRAVMTKYRTARSAQVFAVLAFFIKVPIIGVATWYAGGLGQPAIGCFALGLAVVYFALVGAALWLERAPANRPS